MSKFSVFLYLFINCLQLNVLYLLFIGDLVHIFLTSTFLSGHAPYFSDLRYIFVPSVVIYLSMIDFPVFGLRVKYFLLLKV